MVEQVAAYFAGILLLIGALFSLLAAVGILRLPDLYTRMHAASKAGTMGSGLMLIAIAVIAFDGPVILRALVGVVFLLLTTPVSAHLLARAAYMVGYTPSVGMKFNDLKKHKAR
ncbi:MAG TPA: monovalent cation/H(+) antiporter subunit G [Devosia sp.]|nr:monovalent cation/H(+) antiporter subunit G [Devosia sp.]